MDPAFDAAISLEVLEHLYERAALARSAHRALRPGGTCGVSTPYHGYVKFAALAVSGRAARHFDPLWDGGHIKFFTPRSLRALLTKGGFVDVTVR